jgi:hypothetical protein
MHFQQASRDSDIDSSTGRGLAGRRDRDEYRSTSKK